MTFVDSDRRHVLRLANLRPAQVARRTREHVAAGDSVVWVWTKDRDFKRAAAAVGDWRAPHGGMWRLGHGQSVAVFSQHDDAKAALSYFVRDKASA